MIFISYSHDSDDLCDRVLELSNYLRTCGIDSVIDQYEESPPEGWPRWMETQIREAEFVLVVCTSNYQEKAILKVHTDVGLGVKWETNLILNQLYQTGTVTSKYIPIVFSDSDVKFILDPLKGQTYYNLAYSERRDALRNRLLGIKANKKSPLGYFIPKEEKEVKSDARMLITGVINLDLWNIAGWKGAGYAFNYQDIPYFGLQFENEKIGCKIFEEWKIRFGDVDIRDEIYISLIEEENSNDYHVHIGINFDALTSRLKNQGLNGVFNTFMIIDRWHKMNLVNRNYLEEFKKEFKRYGEFLFMPFVKQGNQFNPVSSLSIKKKIIHFRKISEVKNNKNDYDSLAHHPNTDEKK